jgi:excisionase family DNA binding protein
MLKTQQIPIYEKFLLTVEEASQYFNIGRDKMYELAKEEGSKFVLHNGRIILIKRKLFEKYLEQNSYI